MAFGGVPVNILRANGQDRTVFSGSFRPNGAGAVLDAYMPGVPAEAGRFEYGGVAGLFRAVFLDAACGLGKTATGLKFGVLPGQRRLVRVSADLSLPVAAATRAAVGNAVPFPEGMFWEIFLLDGAGAQVNVAANANSRVSFTVEFEDIK